MSPEGNDANPGTIDRPFATIERARDAVREINRNMTGDIIVYLRDGTYRLERTLEFDERDSGTNGYRVIYQAYPGESPIISGECRSPVGNSMTAAFIKLLWSGAVSLGPFMSTDSGQ